MLSSINFIKPYLPPKKNPKKPMYRRLRSPCYYMRERLARVTEYSVQPETQGSTLFRGFMQQLCSGRYPPTRRAQRTYIQTRVGVCKPIASETLCLSTSIQLLEIFQVWKSRFHRRRYRSRPIFRNNHWHRSGHHRHTPHPCRIPPLPPPEPKSPRTRTLSQSTPPLLPPKPTQIHPTPGPPLDIT